MHFPNILSVPIKSKDGKIIFIRRLEQGSSEHSFGIHVAKLSGIPNQIIDRANIILVNLEMLILIMMIGRS